jgi:ribulose-5-phosphate 4-epimerase/fuculose-1-phosphate aldolase
MQHNLAERAKRAMDSGLQLRKRTAAHISAMVGNREYLVTRYGAEMTSTVSQINRLTATLDEVANKVTAMIRS